MSVRPISLLYILLLISTFGGVVESVTGKAVTGAVLVTILMLGVAKTKISAVTFLLGFICLFFSIISSLLYGTPSLEAFLWNTIYGGLLILFLSLVQPDYSMSCATWNSTMVKLSALFTLVLAVSHATLQIGYADNSKPMGFSFGALYFGIFVFLIAALPSANRAQMAISYSIFALAVIFGSIHKSKALFFMSLLFLLITIFDYLRHRVKNHPIFVSIMLCVLLLVLMRLYIEYEDTFGILTVLLESPRFSRASDFIMNVSLFGGNLLSYSGPLGSLPSSENYFLHIYGTYGLPFLIFFIILVSKRLEFRIYTPIFFGMMFTEPLVGYAAFIAFLSILGLYQNSVCATQRGIYAWSKK